MRTISNLRKIGFALLCAVVVAGAVEGASIAPQQNYSSDVSQPTRRRDLVFRQATSQKLGWTFTQGATAIDLTSVTLVTFKYIPADRSWSQVVTGALDVATNGSVLVTFTPAQLNTNSAATPFDWIMEATAGSEVLGYSYGKLTLLADPTSSVTNTFPTTIQTVDWSDVAAYTSTAASGPVRPGTGITATTNADGSLTFAASGSVSGVTTNALIHTYVGNYTLAITDGQATAFTFAASDLFSVYGTFATTNGWSFYEHNDPDIVDVVAGSPGYVGIGLSDKMNLDGKTVTAIHAVDNIVAGYTYDIVFTCIDVSPTALISGNTRIGVALGVGETNVTTFAGTAAGTYTQQVVCGSTSSDLVIGWQNTTTDYNFYGRVNGVHVYFVSTP